MKKVDKHTQSQTHKKKIFTNKKHLSAYKKNSVNKFNRYAK